MVDLQAEHWVKGYPDLNSSITIGGMLRTSAGGAPQLRRTLTNLATDGALRESNGVSVCAIGQVLVGGPVDGWSEKMYRGISKEEVHPVAAVRAPEIGIEIA